MNNQLKDDIQDDIKGLFIGRFLYTVYKCIRSEITEDNLLYYYCFVTL